MCKPVNKARTAVVCYDFRYNVYPIRIGIMQVHNQVKRQTLVVWCKIRIKDEVQWDQSVVSSTITLSVVYRVNTFEPCYVIYNVSTR